MARKSAVMSTDICSVPAHTRNNSPTRSIFRSKIGSVSSPRMSNSRTPQHCRRKVRSVEAGLAPFLWGISGKLGLGKLNVQRCRGPTSIQQDGMELHLIKGQGGTEDRSDRPWVVEELCPVSHVLVLLQIVCPPPADVNGRAAFSKLRPGPRGKTSLLDLGGQVFVSSGISLRRALTLWTNRRAQSAREGAHGDGQRLLSWPSPFFPDPVRAKLPRSLLGACEACVDNRISCGCANPSFRQGPCGRPEIVPRSDRVLCAGRRGGHARRVHAARSFRRAGAA